MAKYLSTWFVALGCCFALSGCDNYTAATYSISPNNDFALKALAPANVTVAGLTAASNVSMGCRLVGPIDLPGNLTPQDYISQALSDELRLAGISGNAGSSVTITGQINTLSFSSMSGEWQIDVTLNSSNGKSMDVSERYSFHTSYMGDAACHDVADAFEPAVQALIATIIADPRFSSMIKAPTPLTS